LEFWRFRQAVCHALNAVFDQFDVPVDQEAKFTVFEFEVGKQLCLMNWQNIFNRFVFNDD
jgi:hypothetical protein